MSRSQSRKQRNAKLPAVDEQEMLRIAHRSCLKSFTISKRFSRQVESIALKALFTSAGELYLHIYGLLGKEIEAETQTKEVVSLPAEAAIDTQSGRAENDIERLEQATALDGYVLDLLRLIINRIDHDPIKIPLSSKIASLQILHDRMKELHDAYC